MGKFMKKHKTTPVIAMATTPYMVKTNPPAIPVGLSRHSRDVI
jgi:hypothetical protein